MYDQYSVRLKNLEKDYQNELKQLAFLVGSDTPVTLAAIENDDWQSLTQSLPALVEATNCLRPDLKATQQQQHVADANINLQKALAKPMRVNLFGEIGVGGVAFVGTTANEVNSDLFDSFGYVGAKVGLRLRL